MTIHTSSNFHKVILAGTLVACIGGYVNSLVIIEFAHTVSHMTGNISKLGISIIYWEFRSVLFLTGLLFSFMLGAGTASIIVGNAKFKLGRRYGAALSLEGVLLLIAVCLEGFPTFDIVSQYVLAFACGVQNAMCTNYSGAVVRTTHLTGIVTDIAMVTGFWLKYHQSHPQSIEVWKLKILVPLACGFLGGAMLGSAAFELMGRVALLVPATLTVVVSTLYIIKTHKEALALQQLEKLRAIRYKEAEAHLKASGGFKKGSRTGSRVHSRRESRVGSRVGSRIGSRVPSPVASPSMSRVTSMEFSHMHHMAALHHSHDGHHHHPLSRSISISNSLAHDGHHPLPHEVVSVHHSLDGARDGATTPSELNHSVEIIGHSSPTSPQLGIMHREDELHHESTLVEERQDEDDIFDTSDEDTDSEDEIISEDDLERYVEETPKDQEGGGAILV